MHVDNDGNLCKVQATPASSVNPATEIVARGAINRALAAFFFLCLVSVSSWPVDTEPMWTIMDIDWMAKIDFHDGVRCCYKAGLHWMH